MFIDQTKRVNIFKNYKMKLEKIYLRYYPPGKFIIHNKIYW